MSIGIKTGDIVQARLEFRAGDTIAYNVLDYQVGATSAVDTNLPPATEVPIQDFAMGFAQDVYDQIADEWKVAASNQVTFQGVTVQSPYPLPRSRPYYYSPTTPVVGSVNGDALPLQDTPTLLKRSLYGEKWGLGRFFYVGLAESMAQNGYITGAAVTALEALCEKLKGSILTIADLTNIALYPVIFVRRSLDTVPPSYYMRTTAIVDFGISDTIIKTQRRRRPGKGI